MAHLESYTAALKQLRLPLSASAICPEPADETYARQANDCAEIATGEVRGQVPQYSPPAAKVIQKWGANESRHYFSVFVQGKSSKSIAAALMQVSVLQAGTNMLDFIFLTYFSLLLSRASGLANADTYLPRPMGKQEGK